ncbi:MAG TPA: S-adenosylmethionine decarboxylase [Patescibacteria group bacterium]
MKRLGIYARTPSNLIIDGIHLTVDALGCDPLKLQNGPLLKKTLDELPEKLGMNKIADPIVYRYSGEKPEDWGYSGFVVIAESHIAMHTFPNHKFVWIDIFSCKKFDVGMCEALIKGTFGATKLRKKIFDRGIELKDVPNAGEWVNEDRKVRTSIEAMASVAVVE